MIINSNKFIIFFGDKHTCPVSHKSPEFQAFCNNLAQKHNLEKIIFQKQVHGVNGIYIDSQEKAKYIQSFDFEGDFLITNQKNIAIGVLTADCLPIIFYDTKNHVAACIHAGWRSSVSEICAKAIQTMFSQFRFSPEDLQIFFGPCAKQCCYEVSPEFLDNLKNFKFKSQVIRKENSKLFFDIVLFNKLLLIDLGLISKNMNFEHNSCTICAGSSQTSKFHSYRKDGEKSLRQISLIGLK